MVGRTLVIGFSLIASCTSAAAFGKTCTNHEIRTIVTSEFIVACTGKGGRVLCDRGKQVCCRGLGGLQVCTTNPSSLSNTSPTRPPSAGTDIPPDRVDPPKRPPRADPPPGSVSPPKNPPPPRADPPPSRVSPPKSTGPSIR
jgi:hypothetical protein